MPVQINQSPINGLGAAGAQLQGRDRETASQQTLSPGSAVFESEHLMAVTSPCGHTVPIEQAMEGPDRYCCPLCGMRYHIDQDPPEVYPSGFIMPGNRHVVIESQSNLPIHLLNAPRK